MKSSLAKVMHQIGGRTLLGHVLHTARALNPQHLSVVVRHERKQVAAHVAQLDPGAHIADQDEIPGTGRAVQCAIEDLEASVGQLSGSVMVLAGDVPLLDAATLEPFLAAHHSQGNAVTILTTHVPNPFGYGRIIRDSRGGVAKIVEQKDASPQEAAIDEINSSVYVFDADVLRAGLATLDQNNAQGEVYLTDVVAYAHHQDLKVAAHAIADSILVEGVNDKAQLATLGKELNRRVTQKWMREGVTMVDPDSTWIDVTAELARDVTLLPGVQLHGNTRIAAGATVGPDTTLRDVEVGEGAQVVRTHGSQAKIAEGAHVGPFSYLRPGTVLGKNGKIGSFVEVKNSTIGEDSKVPHLSYLGDAQVGTGTNVGAASVTVNYDGENKHRTVIGDYCRTGSDNMFVAPVTVNDGAYTGAGTVVRQDVPAGALAVNDMGMRIIEDWVISHRAGTASARAAEAAKATQESPEDDPLT